MGGVGNACLHACVMRKCLHSVCLSVCLTVCLPFSFLSWLRAHDKVHISSLGEGKTIVPVGFPYLNLDSTKPLLTVTSPHTSRCCLVSLEKAWGKKGKLRADQRAVSRLPAFATTNNGVTSHWLARVHAARVQTSGSLQPSFTNHFPPPSSERDLAGTMYGEKSLPQGRNCWRSGAGSGGGQEGSERKANTPSFWANW